MTPLLGTAAALFHPAFLRLASESAIAVAILFMPSGRLDVNEDSTCERDVPAFSPCSITRCVSRLRPSASPSNRHSNDRAAPSSCLSIVAAFGGVISRMSQRNVSSPGKRVTPRDPHANGPSKSNSAGGTDQRWLFVPYFPKEN